jgi:hypothetical protein
MTLHHINNPKHWRDRAVEARANAEHVTGVFKKSLLTVAANYERLAKMAKDRNEAVKAASSTRALQRIFQRVKQFSD